METDHLPEISADEVERRADVYVESSLANVQLDVLEQQGITMDQMRFAVRRTFYNFITSHFDVVPKGQHPEE